MPRCGIHGLPYPLTEARGIGRNLGRRIEGADSEPDCAIPLRLHPKWSSQMASPREPFLATHRASVRLGYLEVDES